MNEAFIHLLAIITASIIGSVGVGLCEKIIYSDGCESKMVRVEYVFPFYRLGCWLGERVE